MRMRRVNNLAPSAFAIPSCRSGRRVEAVGAIGFKARRAKLANNTNLSCSCGSLRLKVNGVPSTDRFDGLATSEKDGDGSDSKRKHER
jgi:hypothetical protein